MNAKFKYLLTGLLLGSTVWGAQAQALRAGYFSESYLLRHEMNPALANSCDYYSLPVLGSTHLDVGANFGVKNLIFERKYESGLTTFMNPEVSESFLDDLKRQNKLCINMDMPVISVGFNAFGGYNTIGSGMHIRSTFGLDKNLFRFMKELASRDYDLSETRFTLMAWEDISLGHSRQITDELRVGTKIKAMIGLTYADANFDGTQAIFSQDAWQMHLRGALNIAGGGYMQAKENSDELNSYEDYAPENKGFGMAFDFGATYKMPMVEGLTLSAAVTDLGWIKWDCQKAVADNEPFRFEGFNHAKVHSGQGSTDPETGESGYYDGTINEQWERINDDLEDMVKFKVAGTSTVNHSVGATLTLGAEYALPVYDKVTFGALYTQRFSRTFGYVEGRLVANYAPSSIFDVALTTQVTSYGASLGTLVNLRVPGFNFFLGFDRLYLGSYNSDMVPLNKGGVDFAFGINVPIGFSKRKPASETISTVVVEE